MNYLLDTHVVLWWLNGEPRLSEKVKDIISSGNSIVFLSAVVMWEIRIKQQLAKLEIPNNFRAALDNEKFAPLAITFDHVDTLLTLPMHHRDPFDRMLIAQAKHERLTLISHDSHLKKYKIPLLLA